MKNTVIRSMQSMVIDWFFFFIGISIMSFGIVLLIRADLGSAPWDVFHVGLHLQLGLTIGTWSIIIGLIVLGTATLLDKRLPQLGAFLNMLFVGIFIDLFMLLPFLITPSTFIGKLVMFLIGVTVLGYGIALYIAANRGVGPRDSLIISLTRITGINDRWIRSGMELIVLFIGWILGGPVFIGTIIFGLTIGTVVSIATTHCKPLVRYANERVLKLYSLPELQANNKDAPHH